MKRIVRFALSLASCATLAVLAADPQNRAALGAFVTTVVVYVGVGLWQDWPRSRKGHES